MVAGDDEEEIKVKVTIKKPPPKDPEVKIKIKKPPPKDAGPPASPTTLAIEAAFVQAASGMNGGNYEFSLMEFVRATRDAYDEGVMVPALNLELSTCQQYSAGRPLQADEIELRTVWLSLVYLTFERVGYESKRTGGFLGQSVAADLRQKFHTFTVSAPPPPPPPPLMPLHPRARQRPNPLNPRPPTPVRRRQREEARLRPGGAEARRGSPKRRGAVTHGAGDPQPGHADMLLGHPSNGGGLTLMGSELLIEHLTFSGVYVRYFTPPTPPPIGRATKRISDADEHVNPGFLARRQRLPCRHVRQCPHRTCAHVGVGHGS